MHRRKVDVARVRELLARGCTQSQVAARLGVAKSAVCQIASGKYGKDKEGVTDG